MYPETSRSKPKRSGIEKEEERAWMGFYRRSRFDAGLASEVLAQLEADPDSKRAHLALYLRCRQTLRQRKARQQRNKRAAQFLKRSVLSLLEGLAGLSRRFVMDVRDIRAELGSRDRKAVGSTRPGKPISEHRPASRGTDADGTGELGHLSKVA